MKDRIIAAAMRLAVIVAAGLAAVACRVDKGSGDFDYTSAGYMLFNNANDALQEFSKAIDRMQGLDLYIGAADDATREAIRNRFFHDKRIVPDAQNEGIWLIISESATMEIDTGRKRLGDEGAAWSYAYLNGKYDGSRRPTLRRTAPDTYTFNVPGPVRPQRRVHLCRGRQPGRAPHLRARRPARGILGHKPLGTLHERLRLRLRQARARGGDTRRRNLLGPHERHDGGTMQLDATSRGSTDKATARYLTPHTVDIEYEGSASTWIY